jgi:hypothetical protein
MAQVIECLTSKSQYHPKRKWSFNYYQYGTWDQKARPSLGIWVGFIEEVFSNQLYWIKKNWVDNEWYINIAVRRQAGKEHSIWEELKQKLKITSSTCLRRLTWYTGIWTSEGFVFSLTGCAHQPLRWCPMIFMSCRSWTWMTPSNSVAGLIGLCDYVSQISHHCDRMPDINNLKGGKLYSAHSFRGFSPSWQGGCGRAIHIKASRKQSSNRKGPEQDTVP